MKDKHKYRTAFLQFYIKELISNLGNPFIENQETEHEINEDLNLQNSEQLEFDEIQTNSETFNKNHEFSGMKPSAFVPTEPHHHEEYKPSVSEIDPEHPIPIQALAPGKKMPLVRPPPGSINLGKINFLLYDPRVESIECLGDKKNIVLKKNGTIQTTPFKLTKEEIVDVINEFSARTRIPLVGGTFKAAYQNLIMTAITSQYTSGRFLILKKPKRLPLRR
jgi:hypothetical protein